MKTINAKIRYGKQVWDSRERNFITTKYIYSPLLVHGECDGKIQIPGTGTDYAAKIYLHGAPQPAAGKQKIALSSTFEKPRSDIGYNSHGSFLKINIIA